jgi:HlyD family secretion protein
MPKADSSLTMLVVAAGLALGIGYYVPQILSHKPTPAYAAKAEEAPKIVLAQAQTPAPASQRQLWSTSAPGRVEPAGGEIRMSAQVPGRVTEVLVGVNDKVAAGDLLIRLADEDLAARVNAARAEVAVRKRDRDNETVAKAGQDRRAAEDRLADAEQKLTFAREDLDRALKLKRNANGAATEIDKARDAATKAGEQLDQARTNLRKVMSNDPPAPTRLEAGLAAARAELSLAEAALERTRIRAPSNGSILQLNARVGETVAPSPENLLVVLGDVTSLRVRAELEERDIGKVRIGQGAVVRSDAFPGKDFEGSVSSLARSLGPSKLGQRGPRRPTDIDVLEVIIDLTGEPPLLPGMRVDVFLKADASMPSASSAPVQSKRT